MPASEERIDVIREMYANLNKLAQEKIPGWVGLPTSDPSRILLETVAEFAGDLYLKVKPETERLFEALPGFFQGMEAPLYGSKTVKSVQQFQRKHNIKDDGKFHTESKMLLYNLLSIYKTPPLQKP